MPPLDKDRLLLELTTEEKINLLAGRDFWHTVAVPRLNIPSIRLSDGPNGVRGTKFFDGVPAACFPCGTGLGATWDTALIEAGGKLMGAEAIAKGASVLLGPTVNIQRSPLGGRGFESFSEDPYLSGAIAAATIQGIQSTGVAATIKHFVCNDQEHERQVVSSVVSERALREIYLMPFMVTMREKEEQNRPWAVMTAYNRLNGVHCSESERLLKSILREEWAWEGFVMSDWYGTYSTAEAIKAGLDLEMPGPPKLRGEQLRLAMGSGKLKQHMIDERVGNLIELINRVEKSGVEENAEEKGNNTKETSKLLRDVAAATIVLLKNENNILPFDKNKTIAVMGPNAKIAAFCGGGSAALRPYYAVTPYDAMKAQAPNVKYTLGASGYKYLPLLSEMVQNHEGKSGFTSKTYAEPWTSEKRTVVDEIHVEKSDMMLVDYEPPSIEGDVFYLDLEADLTPEEDGIYEFGLSVHGTARLLIDGACVIDNSKDQKPGGTFFGAGTKELFGELKLQAARTYKVVVQFGSAATSSMRVAGVPAMRGGGFRLGGIRKTDPHVEIEKAVQLAKEVDQVVIVVGLSSDWESEGYDRSHMDLPGLTDSLISAVSAVNDHVAVVVQSGTPVTMPWASSNLAILQAWYGGNETGNGIADILLGAVNPSGKLPLSFPHRNEDNPAFLNFRSERGRAIYGEDVYVGYRFYEKTKKDVLFPFGHGLSYTQFEMADLKVEVVAKNKALDGIIKVSVSVSNTGSAGGAEVVQVYISQNAPSINRPPKELKGFSKVFLKPGETKEIELVISLKYATSFWDEERDMWIMEKDTYVVLVGNSSAHTPLKANFKVDKITWWNGL